MHPFIPGQTRKEKFLFLNSFHNFSHNCLLQIFIPLATTGAPGHLPKSLPMHKDEGFWLIQGLLLCCLAMKFSHQIPPTKVSQLVPSAGSPGQEGWQAALIIHGLCGGVSKPGTKPGVRFGCAQLCSPHAT